MKTMPRPASKLSSSHKKFPNRQKHHSYVFVTGFPRRISKTFHAACIRKKIQQRDVVVQFMRDFAMGKVKVAPKKIKMKPGDLVGTLFMTAVPQDTKAKFRIACNNQDFFMKDILIQFMRDYSKQNAK